MPAARVVAAPGDNLLLHPFDALLETPQGLDYCHQAAVQRRRDALVRRIGEGRHQLADVTATLSNHNAKLRHQPAQCIGQHGALLNQHLAHFMNAGRRLLHLGLDRDKAHRRAAHRLADRRGIGRVVFVAPQIGLGVSRRDQPHLMPQLGDLDRSAGYTDTIRQPDQRLSRG